MLIVVDIVVNYCLYSAEVILLIDGHVSQVI